MTWFFIELWQTYNVRPPIFILYFAGLILAVIVFIRKSPVLLVLSGLAMLIGWYDFYSSATTIHKLYVQLAGLLGLVFIKSAKLEVGVTCRISIAPVPSTRNLLNIQSIQTLR